MAGDRAMTESNETITFGGDQLRRGRRLGRWLTIIGAVLLIFGIIGNTIWEQGDVGLMIGGMLLGSGVTGLVLFSRE